MGEALSDTLGKLTSAHLAGGHTPHEGCALAPVRGAAGAGVYVMDLWRVVTG